MAYHFDPECNYTLILIGFAGVAVLCYSAAYVYYACKHRKKEQHAAEHDESQHSVKEDDTVREKDIEMVYAHKDNGESVEVHHADSETKLSGQIYK